MRTDYILQYHDYRGSLQTIMVEANTVREALEHVCIPQEALESDFTLHRVTASHTKEHLVSSGNYDDIIPE